MWRIFVIKVSYILKISLPFPSSSSAGNPCFLILNHQMPLWIILTTYIVVLHLKVPPFNWPFKLHQKKTSNEEYIIMAVKDARNFPYHANKTTASHGCKTLRTNFCKHYPCLVLSIIWMKHLISLMFVLTSIEASYVWRTGSTNMHAVTKFALIWNSSNPTYSTKES